MKVLLCLFLLNIAFAQEENVVWEQVDLTGEQDESWVDLNPRQELPEEFWKKLRTLHDDDYCVIKKPELRLQAREFMLENYKSFCNTQHEIERILYEGSQILENGINLLTHVLIGDKQYSLEVHLTDYDKLTQVYQKNFDACRLLEEQEQHILEKSEDL